MDFLAFAYLFVSGRYGEPSQGKFAWPFTENLSRKQEDYKCR